MKGINNLLAHQGDVKDLIQPLFDNTNIDFFCYERIYPDNQGFFLTSYPELNKAAVEKDIISSHDKLHDILIHGSEANKLHNIFYLLLRESNKDAEDLVKEYGFHGGTLAMLEEHSDGYIEGFSFSTKNSENLIRFCFSYWDVLAQFKNYFLEKSDDLFRQLAQNKIKMNNRSDDKYYLLEEGINAPFNREKLMQEFKTDHYHIVHKGQRFELTDREFQCLKHCAQGRKDKETARAIGLSPKTVEHYLNNLKVRFSVYSRAELIDIYLASDLVIL